jgi:hypothetical protein
MTGWSMEKLNNIKYTVNKKWYTDEKSMKIDMIYTWALAAEPNGGGGGVGGEQTMTCEIFVVPIMCYTCCNANN